jgi:hypothetical protein
VRDADLLTPCFTEHGASDLINYLYSRPHTLHVD